MNDGEGGAAREYEFTVDGKALKLPLPDDLLRKDEVDAAYVPKQMYQGTVSKLRKELDQRPSRDALLEDPEFALLVAEKHAAAVRERLGVKASDAAELEKAQAAWREREVSPLQKQLEKSAADVQKLLKRSLQSEVRAACAATDVTDEFGEVALDYYERRVKYDPEHDGFFVLGDDGEFEPTTDLKRGKAPYLTVAEHLAREREGGKRKAWFKAEQGRAGGGFRGAGAKGPEPTLQERIAALEADGKFAEAGVLKAELARQSARKRT